MKKYKIKNIFSILTILFVFFLYLTSVEKIWAVCTSSDAIDYRPACNCETSCIDIGIGSDRWGCYNNNCDGVGFICTEPCSGDWTCFPAGTKVLMGDKTQKNIEDVKVGDKIISQSEEGKKTVSTVTKLDQPVRDHMCKIKFTNEESLKLTDEHPLFTQDGWKAINPKNLTRYDKQ